MGFDDEDNIIGPLFTAFKPRPGEQYISVGWVEYFSGSSGGRLRCAIDRIRESRNVKRSTCFCVAIDSKLRNLMSQYHREISIRHHPVPDNDSHAGIYGFTVDDDELFEMIASDAWAEFYTMATSDALDLIECKKSVTATD